MAVRAAHAWALAVRCPMSPAGGFGCGASGPGSTWASLARATLTRPRAVATGRRARSGHITAQLPSSCGDCFRDRHATGSSQSQLCTPSLPGWLGMNSVWLSGRGDWPGFLSGSVLLPLGSLSWETSFQSGHLANGWGGAWGRHHHRGSGQDTGPACSLRTPGAGHACTPTSAFAVACTLFA